MKKVLSILLAFVLAALAPCAFADELTVQAVPTGVSPGLFTALFEFVTSQGDYSYTLEENAVSEDGYEVYTAHANGIAMDVKAYAADDTVEYVIGTAIEYKINSPEEAGKLGTWFGGSLANAVFTVYFGGGGENTDEAMAALNASVDEFLTFLQETLSNYDNLKRGAAMTTSILGYPTGIEISGAANSKSATLNLKFIITGKDGQLEISK